MHPEPRKVVLVGVAGSHNAFSLSLYNLKAYVCADADMRKAWDLRVIQHPLVGVTDHAEKVAGLARRIANEKADLVGFSCYMWNTAVFRDIAKELRKLCPDCKILLGGPEMTTDYLVSGKYDGFSMDYCISGEGELTFLELLRHLVHGTPALSAIDGLSFRNNDNQPFTVNGKREAFKSLALIPSPFLTGVVDDEVLLRPNIEANIETQRGCTLRCAYCVYHKDMGKISYNDVDRTLDEVRFVINKGVKSIRFVDANFSSDLEHAKNVMKGLIKGRFESKLMFELIPGFIDEELTSLFADFNNLHPWNEVTLGVGVQTINMEALHTIRRAIKLEKFETTFDLLKKYRIYAKIDLIIGLPGEDLAAIDRTLEYMMNKLRGNQSHLLCCHIMRGLPGTKLLDIAKEYQMMFTSEFEPHELYESPALPRPDMLRCLRRTAVIFRLVNHSGWANREFIFDRHSQDPCIHDAYFRAKDRLGISNIELLDILIEGLMKHLSHRSYFVQSRFPYAETWWWSLSKREVSNPWLLNFLATCGTGEDSPATDMGTKVPPPADLVTL